MNRRLLCILPAIVLALGLPNIADAQKKEKEKPNERTVIGVVLDNADSPIDGAVVQLKDMKSLQIKSFITRADGKYHFSPLSTEIDYELKATYQGKASNTRLLSTFDSRKHASMNLKIDK